MLASLVYSSRSTVLAEFYDAAITFGAIDQRCEASGSDAFFVPRVEATFCDVGTWGVHVDSIALPPLRGRHDMLVINVNASAVTYLFYGILGPQKEIDKIARHLNAVKRNDTDFYEIDCASRDTYRPIYFWFGEKSVRLNPRDYIYYVSVG